MIILHISSVYSSNFYLVTLFYQRFFTRIYMPKRSDYLIRPKYSYKKNECLLLSELINVNS